MIHIIFEEELQHPSSHPCEYMHGSQIRGWVLIIAGATYIFRSGVKMDIVSLHNPPSAVFSESVDIPSALISLLSLDISQYCTIVILTRKERAGRRVTGQLFIC